MGLLPLGAPKPAPPGERACRVCGCTDQDACVLGRSACSWVDVDLCSRCHGPRRLTRRQRAEVGRIAARYGPVRILPALEPGDVRIVVVRTASHRIEDRGDGRGRRQVVTPTPPTSIVLDPVGRIRERHGPPLRPVDRPLEAAAA